MTEKTMIKFHPISELNDNYLIEYCPPNEFVNFANIQLTMRKQFDTEDVARYIELEANRWAEQFAITTMTTAYHDNEDVFDVTSVRASNHYVVYFDKKGRN